MSDTLVALLFILGILAVIALLMGGVLLSKEQTLRCYDINKTRTATEAVVMCR